LIGRGGDDGGVRGEFFREGFGRRILMRRALFGDRS